ncbi:MAG TPA: hypothetical protein VFJ82_07270 [Longimicrobium sp.]|nr:hypothetical protein [Longimicrobium sp.]
MKKIMLNLETLAVESFPTQEKDAEPLGTVNGAMASPRGTCIANSCYTSCRADLRDACTCPVRMDE